MLPRNQNLCLSAAKTGQLHLKKEHNGGQPPHCTHEVLVETVSLLGVAHCGFIFMGHINEVNGMVCTHFFQAHLAAQCHDGI